MAPPLSETDRPGKTVAGLRAPPANAAFVPTELPERDQMRCPDCGTPMAREQARAHECERDAVLDYRLFLERQDEVTLGDELAAYLASPRGRFEAWYAERRRGGGSA